MQYCKLKNVDRQAPIIEQTHSQRDQLAMRLKNLGGKNGRQ